MRKIILKNNDKKRIASIYSREPEYTQIRKVNLVAGPCDNSSNGCTGSCNHSSGAIQQLK
ncbi:MAG: hypothetical protein KatS3mg097_642 [Candidatus Parcubacteria bacterium]|nr:MAG: hypothetical protein KatS3mg097_642 [Candidatus Parcubacteria bacterium]